MAQIPELRPRLGIVSIAEIIEGSIIESITVGGNAGDIRKASISLKNKEGEDINLSFEGLKKARIPNNMPMGVINDFSMTEEMDGCWKLKFYSGDDFFIFKFYEEPKADVSVHEYREPDCFLLSHPPIFMKSRNHKSYTIKIWAPLPRKENFNG